MIKLKKEQEQKNARSQKRYVIAAFVVEVLLALVFFMAVQDNKEWGTVLSAVVGVIAAESRYNLNKFHLSKRLF